MARTFEERKLELLRKLRELRNINWNVWAKWFAFFDLGLAVVWATVLFVLQVSIHQEKRTLERSSVTNGTVEASRDEEIESVQLNNVACTFEGSPMIWPFSCDNCCNLNDMEIIIALITLTRILITVAHLGNTLNYTIFYEFVIPYKRTQISFWTYQVTNGFFNLFEIVNLFRTISSWWWIPDAFTILCFTVSYVIRSVLLLLFIIIMFQAQNFQAPALLT